MAQVLNVASVPPPENRLRSRLPESDRPGSNAALATPTSSLAATSSRCARYTSGRWRITSAGTAFTVSMVVKAVRRQQRRRTGQPLAHLGLGHAGERGERLHLALANFVLLAVARSALGPAGARQRGHRRGGEAGALGRAVVLRRDRARIAVAQGDGELLAAQALRKIELRQFRSHQHPGFVPAGARRVLLRLRAAQARRRSRPTGRRPTKPAGRRSARCPAEWSGR